MVGRKTSPRCANCRKRKIKCDLSRPACTQCTRSQWLCPGYDSHARFYSYEKKSIGESATTSCSGDTSDSSELNVVERKRGRTPSVLSYPVSATDTLRNKFVFKITQEAVAARFAVIPEMLLLQHIPRRLGRSRALDEAANCICSTSSFQSSPASASPTSRESYGEALCNLQSALTDSKEALASETLAAALLLQMFEQSVGHSQFQWLVHANGVIRMLEMRGPARIRNELDRSILHVQTGNIFFKAVRDRTDCFLANAEWLPHLEQSLCKASSRDYLSNAEFSTMLLTGLQIPGLLCRYEQVKSENTNPTMTDKLQCCTSQGDVNSAALIADLLKTRKLLADWRVRYQLSETKTHCDKTQHKTSPARIQHASRLAVNAFSIVVDYMLVDLFVHNSEELQTLDAKCRQLTLEAKLELHMLRLIDAIAAAQTAELLRTVLSRILDTCCDYETKAQHLRPEIDDLFSDLQEDFCC